MYNVYEIRKDFPVLSELVNNKPNVFLDSAASAQKPLPVLNRMQEIYNHHYANVHRGIYHLSEDITASYEQAREIVKNFINAASADEVIFTRNATESINLVAATWGRKFLRAGTRRREFPYRHANNGGIIFTLTCGNGAVLHHGGHLLQQPPSGRRHI